MNFFCIVTFLFSLLTFPLHAEELTISYLAGSWEFSDSVTAESFAEQPDADEKAKLKFMVIDQIDKSTLMNFDGNNVTTKSTTTTTLKNGMTQGVVINASATYVIKENTIILTINEIQVKTLGNLAKGGGTSAKIEELFQKGTELSAFVNIVDSDTMKARGLDVLEQSESLFRRVPNPKPSNQE